MKARRCRWRSVVRLLLGLAGGPVCLAPPPMHAAAPLEALAEPPAAAEAPAGETAAALGTLPEFEARLEAELIELSETRARLDRLEESLQLQLVQARRQATQLQREFEDLQERIRIRGMTEEIQARYLQRRFEELRREAAPQQRRANRESIAQGLLSLQDQEMDLDERLQRVPESERLLAELIMTVPHEERTAAKDRAQGRLNEKQRLLHDLIAQIGELTSAYHELLDAQADLAGIIDAQYHEILRQVFWVRDSEPLNVQLLLDAGRGVQQLLRDIGAASARWYALFQQRVRQAEWWSTLLAIGVIAPLFVWRLQRGLRGELYRSTQQALDRPHQVSLAEVLRSIGYGLLSVLPAPLYLAALAALPELILAHPAWQEAIARALRLAALLWLLLSAAAVLLGRRGIGQAHFHWPAEACRGGRNLVRVLALSGFVLLVPRLILQGIAEETADPAGLQAVSRVLITIYGLIMLCGVAWGLHARSALIEATVGRSESRLLRRRWGLIWLLAVGWVMAIVGMDWLGYRFGSRQLADRALRGAAMFVTFLVADALLLRSIEVVLRHRSGRQRPKLVRVRSGELGEVTRTASDQQAPSAVDTARQMRRLAHLAVGFVAVLTLHRFWQMEGSLLGILEPMRILSMGGDTGIVVTMADLFRAMFAVVGVWVLSSNLPALFDLLLLPRLRDDSGLRYALVTIARYVLIFAGILAVAAALHFRWSSIQWLLAAVSVGVGFGLQEVVSNFVSGLILLIERPLRVGDIVTVGDISGTVDKINIRATVITNWENLQVIVPNKAFISGNFVNWTLRDRIVRCELSIGVAYGSGIEQVRGLLLACVREHPRVLPHPEPYCFFRAFGDSALMFDIRFYVPDPALRVSTVHEVADRVSKALAAAGIEIPFPQHEVRLRGAEARAAAGAAGALPGAGAGAQAEAPSGQ